MKLLKFSRCCLITILLNLFSECVSVSQTVLKCIEIDHLNAGYLLSLGKIVVPSLDGKKKGDAGKIGVIGGSTEYTGAPYFSAISALKVGADLVYVITTESAAPVIKSYSPDLIVYPFLNENFMSKLSVLLSKMDVIVIGPGLGREDETLKLIYELLEECKKLQKPLVIDADALYAISKNLSSIFGYPHPGVILTPNNHEVKRLKDAVHTISNHTIWYNYWGDNVAVLLKGEEDRFYTSVSALQWKLLGSGSGRRAGGQGDILAGTLGTFYNWAVKSGLCEISQQHTLQLAQSVAAFSAAQFTRTCNYQAYTKFGRSMVASDMLNVIHPSFEELFGI